MTDEEMMARLAGGDTEALNGLIERYQPDIFRFCLHYLKDVERARDLTQETFIRVFTACKRFDESRQFKPWVLCIARNLCLNDLKRKKTVPMESLEEYASDARSETGEIFQSASDTPDVQVAESERRVLLEKVLSTLNPEAREIVVLRFFQRMSAREIAEIVGSTEGAIRTKLHRILASLRKEYQGCKDDL